MRLLSCLAALLVCCGCSSSPAPHAPLKPNQRLIYESDYGKEWPLTVDAGVLTCEGSAVTVEVKGVIYAVNGMAMTWKRGKDIDEIWAPGEPIWVTDRTGKQVNAGPRKKSIGPLIDDGLKLCGR